VDWDTGTWRYCSNDSVVDVIEDDYIALNLGENDPFVLVFFREIEEGNNNFDIDIDNFFYGNFYYLSALFRIWGICRCLF